jgi:hypothetical protein
MGQNRLVVGVFKDEGTILSATRTAKEKGFSIQDVYTPFPVHGMDEAMGMKPNILPRLCFLFGSGGLGFALLFQYWVSTYNWPMNIGGKTFSASPALVPIAFEFTVLCAGLGTVASLFFLRNMFPGKKPAFPELGATNNRFLLALREKDSGEGRNDMIDFLKTNGADSVEEVRGL